MHEIFDTVNNDVLSNIQGISYTWNNQAGGAATSPATIDVSKDTDHRKAAIPVKLTKDVGRKLEEAWNSVTKPDWNKLWSTQPFNVPVKILTVVGIVLGLLFIMGMIIVFNIVEVKPFIIIGISFSVLTTTYIFSTLLRANGQDKVKLKEINATNITYEYYNFSVLYNGTNPVDSTQANTEGETTGGDRKIAANLVNNNYHFKTKGTDAQHAPKIRVTSDLKELGIAKANIIALLNIYTIQNIY